MVNAGSGYLLGAMRKSQQRLAAANLTPLHQAELESRLARTDALTGLANGRLLLERLAAEISCGRRAKLPLSLA